MRAQIELSVCDVPNAGTKDPVSAALNERDEKSPTWLDRPGRDFDRGTRYTYDLSIDHVHTLADVAEIELSKAGNDDLCVRELRLLVNHKTIFLRSFGGGQWLKGSTGNALRGTRAELRANPSWQAYVWSLSEWIAATGGAISPSEVVERLEGCVATAIHGLGLTWKASNAPAIRLQRRDDSTVSARVDLVRSTPYWIDTDVVLDFDLPLCEHGHAAPAITRVALRTSSPWYAIALGHSRAAEDQRELALLRDRLTHMRPLAMPDGICPHVDAYGGITY